MNSDASSGFCISQSRNAANASTKLNCDPRNRSLRYRSIAAARQRNSSAACSFATIEIAPIFVFLASDQEGGIALSKISHRILQAQRLLAQPLFGELRRACAGRQRVDPIWPNPPYAKLVFPQLWQGEYAKVLACLQFPKRVLQASRVVPVDRLQDLQAAA